MPRGQLFDHSAQIELHGDDALGSPIVTLWLSAACIEVTSTPPESCEQRLRRLEPVLEFFRDKGFAVPAWAELITEYEEQRRRVETVARMIGARLPNV